MRDSRAAPNEIAGRLRAFRATGDPGRLWPDVLPQARIAAQRHIYDVAAEMLRGEGGATRLSSPGDGTRVLGIAAHVLGMGALLGHWIERGALHAEGPVRAVMTEHLEHGRRRARLMAGRLDRVLGAANAREVEPIVLKGAYTGLRYFPEPGARPSSDIDLLIEPERLRVMQQVLHDLGFAEHEVNPHQSTWRPSGESPEVLSLELDHADGPWSIDLHSAIDRRYFWGRWTRFGARQYEQVRSWTVGRCRARVFTQPLLASHLAQHAVNDYRTIRLIRLVELVEVLRHDLSCGELAWDALVALLEKTQTGLFAYPAFWLCSRLVPGLVDDEALRYLESLATPRMRRVVDEWHGLGVGIGGAGSLDERLMWARTPYDHMCNVAHQIARRGMALYSPVTTPRLRLLARRVIGRSSAPGGKSR